MSLKKQCEYRTNDALSAWELKSNSGTDHTQNYGQAVDNFLVHVSNTGQQRLAADGGQQQVGTDQCNESLKHSNIEKSVFHGMKSAKRLKDEGLHMQAVQVAGEVAKGFLMAEDIKYVPEKSEKHLVEKIKDKVLGGDQFDEISKGIEKAWDKIDGGHHKGGARVAVAVADEYLEDFDTSEVV